MHLQHKNQYPKLHHREVVKKKLRTQKIFFFFNFRYAYQKIQNGLKRMILIKEEKKIWFERNFFIF